MGTPASKSLPETSSKSWCILKILGGFNLDFPAIQVQWGMGKNRWPRSRSGIGEIFEATLTLTNQQTIKHDQCEPTPLPLVNQPLTPDSL